MTTFLRRVVCTIQAHDPRVAFPASDYPQRIRTFNSLETSLNF